MKKNVSIIALLLVLATASLAVSVAPVKATHTMTVNVSPKVYNGGPELKTFNVTNNPTSPNDIIQVVITFPTVQAGDTDYKPKNYTFPDNWAATYEPGLRQVIFGLVPPTGGIVHGASGIFTIYFQDGPYMEGIYTWTVSTTDDHMSGFTVYPTQTIDRTPPFVRIDVPADRDVVNGTMVDVSHSYMWVYVTAYDHPLPGSTTGSGIASLTYIISGVTNPAYTTSGVFNVNAPVSPNQYKIQVWNLPSDNNYTITAKATDGAGNTNSTTNRFRYQLVIPSLTVGPTTTTRAGLVVGSIYRTLGTNYTISWSAGLPPSSTATIEVRLPTYASYASKSYWVPVAKATCDATGGGKAWFIFPTTPNGLYVIRAAVGTVNYTQIVRVIPGIVLEPGTGPALVNTTATGLTANSVWASGMPGPALLCNDTDALLGANYAEISNQWYTNGNGTLSTKISTPDHYVNTAFTMPMYQSATYRITLTLHGGNWYNGTNWQPKYCEVSSSISVVSSTGLLVDIKADTAYIRNGCNTINATLNQLSPVILRIDGNVVTLLTNVGKINATLNQLSPVITRIDGNVVTINSALGKMNTTLNAIKAKIDSIDWTGLATWSTSFGKVNATINRIDGNTISVKTNTDTIPNLTMPIYIAVILSLIAAIAAIACAILVLRKIA